MYFIKNVTLYKTSIENCVKKEVVFVPGDRLSCIFFLLYVTEILVVMKHLSGITH